MAANSNTGLPLEDVPAIFASLSQMALRLTPSPSHYTSDSSATIVARRLDACLISTAQALSRIGVTQ
ncbi:unnamed protein product [Protopolystoma xenopodis]|uniref:Uncharacterized protein n=1 Tax=Protopolystoma xenopodis TaxID=117903 RepID=A0A448WHF2_9PLAT|nr:unnamed protein product [Protopolystoma xenopodis]